MVDVMIKLSLRERQERQFLFAGLFVLSICCLGISLMFNRDDGSASTKAELEILLQEDAAFESTMEKIKPTLEKLQESIISFNPEINAIFLENDIMMEIKVINSLSNPKTSDPMYKSFNLFADLYLNLFADKKELSGNQRDLLMIRKSVEDCQLAASELQAVLK